MSALAIIIDFAPGREGVGTGLVPQAPAGAGVLSPRRRGEGVGASPTVAGAVRFGGGPVLLGRAKRCDGLTQGGARPVVGKAAHDAPGSQILLLDGFRAQRAACHHVNAGGFTHG